MKTFWVLNKALQDGETCSSMKALETHTGIPYARLVYHLSTKKRKVYETDLWLIKVKQLKRSKR